MPSQVIIRRIDELCDKKPFVDPQSQKAELRENTWGIYASHKEAKSAASAEITAAIIRVADRWLKQIREEGSPPWTFYVWYDEQAGTLRLSAESAPVDGLSFGAPYDETARLEDIVQAWLSSRYLEGIPWSELRVPEDWEDTEEILAKRPPLPVWIRCL
jgi:hypothetical protein